MVDISIQNIQVTSNYGARAIEAITLTSYVATPSIRQPTINTLSLLSIDVYDRPWRLGYTRTSGPSQA